MASVSDSSGGKEPSINEQSKDVSSDGRKENRLALEKSPYLLQHATNPVDWYPWGEEAFKAAVEQNKLIFLSVGYSTCHWCHVMERESFENPSVADIMNKNFINVKVDREERPDVDKVYMSFVTSLSGSGGWPMSVWLTPELLPVYGGTYFPPNDLFHGRPGFTTILQALAKQWTSNEDKMRTSGTKIVSVLNKNIFKLDQSAGSSLEAATDSSTSKELFEPGAVPAKCLLQLTLSYESGYGGFSGAPKFPQPSNLTFLFTYFFLNPEDEAAQKGRDMALHTLDMMARGGIHDHVSNGFHRYSTDMRWHVPHFEKMLYDQAQLVQAYLDAYLATGKQRYADVVDDILLYVMRDLSHKTGGFYSAEDADSYPSPDSKKKREGAFCVWSHAEVVEILEDMPESKTDLRLVELFCYHYSVAEEGNVDPYNDPHEELKHQNVLIEHFSISETAEKFGLTEEAVLGGLRKALMKLHERRQFRPRPDLDDKMITAWNGMMLSAISRAGAVLHNSLYLERAEATARFILEHLSDSVTGHLYRAVYRGENDDVVRGEKTIYGFCDDYAWAIRGLISLYAATLKQQYLEAALRLQHLQDEFFWDSEHGGYYITREGDDSLLFRIKDNQDGAEPSMNSISAINLLRLSRLVEQPHLLDKFNALLVHFADRLNKLPLALPEMTTALLMSERPPMQVILSGSLGSPSMQEMMRVVHSFPSPNRALLVATDQEDSPLYTLQPSLRNYRPRRDSAGASSESGEEALQMRVYLCHDFKCSLPLRSPSELQNKLKEVFKFK